MSTSKKAYVLAAAMSCFLTQGVLASQTQIEHYTLPENRPKNLPFSEAVRVGDTVYLAGQIGIPPGESELVAGGIEPEAEQTLVNIGLVLRHFSLTHDDIVKCQVMMADISEWPRFNAVYKRFFSSPYPARSAFAGSGLAFGARVEAECVAIIPNSTKSSLRNSLGVDNEEPRQCVEEGKFCSGPCCPGLVCRPSGSRAGVPYCFPPLED